LVLILAVSNKQRGTLKTVKQTMENYKLFITYKVIGKEKETTSLELNYNELNDAIKRFELECISAIKFVSSENSSIEWSIIELIDKKYNTIKEIKISK
jgi:hypothetical protein